MKISASDVAGESNCGITSIALAALRTLEASQAVAFTRRTKLLPPLRKESIVKCEQGVSFSASTIKFVKYHRLSSVIITYGVELRKLQFFFCVYARENWKSMYRIQQQLVSWVCGNLADIAEVDPDNIAPSLTTGSIVLNSVNLRTTKINKLSPLHVADGKINQLRVSIPWLSRTVQPIQVVVDGLTINTTLIANDSRDDPVDEHLELDELIGTYAQDALVRSVHRSTNSIDSDEDDDFHSCKSDTESVSSGSDSDDDASPSTVPQGLFRSVVSRVATYVSPSLFAPRAVDIDVKNIRLVLLPHDAAPFGLCVSVRSVQVHVEPPSQTGPNGALRVVKIAIKGVTIATLAHGEKTQILSVDDSEIVDTTSCDSLGAVIAKNIRVAMENSSIRISFPELAVDTMLKCALSFIAFSRTPAFARPFLSLRQSHSRWAFARASILALIADRKRRWNFNLSHLRAFRVARRHYLDLLDQCHRDCALNDALRIDIRATESELVYRDVVLALREVTMSKFERSLQQKDSSDTRAAAHSIHFSVGCVVLTLPGDAECRLSQITLVTRDNELTFTVDSMELILSGGTIKSSRTEPPFLKVQKNLDPRSRSAVTALELRSFDGNAKFADILRTLLPFINCSRELASEQRRTQTIESHQQIQRNTINALFHGATVNIDEFSCHFRKISLSVTSGGRIAEELVRSVFVVGVMESSISHKGSFILAPFSVRTIDTNRIGVSPMRLTVEQAVIDDLTALSKLVLSLTNSVGSPTSTHQHKISVPSSGPPPLQNVLAMAPRKEKLLAIVDLDLLHVEVPSLHLLAAISTVSCSVGDASTSADIGESFVSVAQFRTTLRSICAKSQQLSISDSRVATKLAMDQVSVSVDGHDLAVIHKCTAGLCDGDLAVEAATAIVACGVVLSPLKLAATKVRDAIPSRTHPYHASNVFLLANVERIEVDKVVHHQGIAKATQFINDTALPMAQRFMPIPAQQLFMSGLSNLSIHLTASKSETEPCEVNLSDDVGTTLYLSLSQRQDVSFGRDQASRGSVISVVNHCHALAVEAQVSSLHATFAPDAQASQWVSVTLDGIRCVQPMSVLEYWTDNCVKEVTPPEVMLEIAKGVIEFTGPVLPTQRNQIECVIDKFHIKAIQAAQDESAFTPSSLQSHAARVRLQSHLASQHDLLVSLDKWKALLPNATTVPSIIGSSRAHGAWNRELIVIDAPFEVIQLEECEFTLASPIEITENSLCIFRKCHFLVPQGGEVFRNGDEALGLLEDCVIDAEVGPTAPSPATLPFISLSCDQFAMSVDFAGMSIVRLRMNDCRLQSSVGDTVHLRSQHSLTLHCGDEKFSIVENASFSVDGFFNQVQRNARLSLHVAPGTVKLPLHLLSTLTKSWSIFNDVAQAKAAHAPQQDPISMLEKWTWYIDAGFPLKVTSCIRDGTPLVTVVASHLYIQSQRLALGSRMELNYSSRVRVQVLDPVSGNQLDITDEDVSSSMNISHDKGLNIEGLLSPSSITLTDTVIQVVQCVTSGEHKLKSSLTIVNELGTPIQVRVPHGGGEWQSSAFVDQETSNTRIGEALFMRLCNLQKEFVEIAEWKCHFDDTAAFPLRTCDVVLGGGTLVRVTLKTSRDLVQLLTVHTLVAICNRLPDRSMLMAGHIEIPGTLRQHVVPPGSTRHVPLHLVDDAQFQIVLVDNDLDQVSLPLKASPRAIVQRCVNEGPSNLGRRHDIRPAGLPLLVIDTSVKSSDPAKDVTLINVLPGLPTVVNHLPIPVAMTILCDDGRPLLTVDVEVGSATHLYCLPTRETPVALEFQINTFGGSFVSLEPLALSSAVNEEEVCVVMRNSTKHGHCFEVAVLPFVGADGCTLSITCTTGFVMQNALSIEAVVASDQGSPLGTCGDTPIRPGALCILPTTTPLIVDVENSNGEFTVEDASNNQTIVCPTTPYCGPCLFLVPERHLLAGDHHLANVEWRQDILRRSFKSWKLISPLEIHNNTPNELRLSHFVAPVAMLRETKSVQGFSMPPFSTKAVTTLALSGFRDGFVFGIGSTQSDPITFAMLPESSDDVHIQLGDESFKISVVKGIPCSTAIMTVSPSKPPISLFNATPIQFEGFLPFSYTAFTPALRESALVLKFPSGEVSHLNFHGITAELVPNRGVFVIVKQYSTHTCVVLSTTGGALRKKRATIPMTLNLKLSRNFLTLFSKGRAFVCAGFEGVNFWVKETSSKWTLQVSACDFEVRNLLESCAVLSPVRTDLTLQDVVLLPNNRICVRSVRANITRLELSVSDKLLAALAIFKENVAKSQEASTPSLKPSATWEVVVQSIAIAELHLVFSWERNGDSAQSKLLRKLAGLLTFIGSVNCMTLTLPMFQVEYQTPTNVLEVTTILSKHYIAALLLHAGRVISSFKAVGSPLAWASGLIAGVHSAISSDAVRRALAAPLSLFASSEELTQATIEAATPIDDGWVCINCSKVHEAIIGRADSLAVRFGGASLSHHCSVQDRLSYLRQASVASDIFFSTLAINMSSSAEIAPLRLTLKFDTNPESVNFYSAHELFAGCVLGIFPPFYDPWWSRAKEIWKPRY